MWHHKLDPVQGRNVEAVQDPPLEGLGRFHQSTHRPSGQADSNCREYKLMTYHNKPKLHNLYFQLAAIVLGSFFFGKTLSLDQENVQGCNSIVYCQLSCQLWR